MISWRGSLSCLILLGFVTPFNSLAVLPNALSADIFLTEYSSSVLFAVLPFSLVDPSISESKHPVTLFLVVFVFTLISTPIKPGKYPFTFHLVVYPLTLVSSTIVPNILAETMNVVLNKISLVATVILPHELSLAMFFAITIITFVYCLVRPGFLTVAMLLVVSPLAFILGSTSWIVSPWINIELYLCLKLDHWAINPHRHLHQHGSTFHSQKLGYSSSILHKENRPSIVGPHGHFSHHLSTVLRRHIYFRIPEDLM